VTYRRSGSPAKWSRSKPERAENQSRRTPSILRSPNTSSSRARVFGLEPFAFGDRRFAGQHPLEIGGRAAVIGFANAGDVAACARSSGEVLLAGPIHLIVPAAAAGPGEVRDLIVLEAAACERVDCLSVESARSVSSSRGFNSP